MLNAYLGIELHGDTYKEGCRTRVQSGTPGDLHVYMMSASKIGLRQGRLRLVPAAESRDDLGWIIRLREPLGHRCIVEHICECGKDTQMLVGFRRDADHQPNHLPGIPLDSFR